MSKDNDGVRWANFALTDSDSWFPVFGKWCGPGYSAGRRIKIIDESDKETEPATHPFTKRVSPIDLLCKEHDLEYERAKGRADEAVKLAADIVLLNKLRQLDENELTPEEIFYRFAMEYLFNLITIVPRTVLSENSYAQPAPLDDETKKLIAKTAHTLVEKSARKFKELMGVVNYVSDSAFEFAFPKIKEEMKIKLADFMKETPRKKSSHSQEKQQIKLPEPSSQKSSEFHKAPKFSEEDTIRVKSRNYV